MADLRMRLGKNLGEILLEMAQEHIKKGNPEKAIETYTSSLHGFTEEYALMLLKNEGVLVTDPNGMDMDLKDDTELIEANKKNIYDWQSIMNKQEEYISDLRTENHKIATKFIQNAKHNSVNDFNLMNYGKCIENKFGDGPFGMHHLCARVISGVGFADVHSSGEPSWERLRENVINDEAYSYERTLFYLAEYVNNIRLLAKEYKLFANTYSFLEKHSIIEHIPFVENVMENVIEILNDFANPNIGYYHPMCDEEIANLKEDITGIIAKTSFGWEYLQNGIIQKNILDGYDAGWLSPDGEYYGDVGEVSAMIHMNLAEQIYSGDSKYGKQMKEDKVSRWSINSPEHWLQKKGWVKIHHQDCYGSFIGSKDFTDYPYCPTQTQIKMICKYADTLYNGKFYTEYNSLGMGRHSHPESYSTYKVKQMDDIMLHKIFTY